MATAKTGRGLGFLLKKGWNEIPEVLGSSFMALLGVGMGFAGLAIYESKKPNCRIHKFDYIVVRPGDPRAPNKKQ